MQHIVGMRIVKTTLSLTICLVVSYLIGYGIPVYACMASVLSMKVTPEASLQSGIDRTVATIIGGVVALLALLLSEAMGLNSASLSYRLLIAATVFANLLICKVVHLKEYVCSFSCVVIIIVLISHTEGDVLTYIAVRVIETVCGIVVAVVINRFVALPKRDENNISDES